MPRSRAGRISRAATLADRFEVLAAFYQLIDCEAKTLIYNKLRKYIDIESRMLPW